MPIKNHLLLFSLWMLMTLGILPSTNLFAQPAEKMSPEDMLSDPVFMTWLDDVRFTACVRCHAGGVSPVQILSGDLDKLTEFARQEEMLFWLQKDKHTIARVRIEPLTDSQSETVLFALDAWLGAKRKQKVGELEEAGVRIDPSRLGFDKASVRQWFGTSNQLSRRICDKYFGEGVVETPAGYERFRNECLTCHGGYQNQVVGFAPFVSGAVSNQDFDPKNIPAEVATDIVGDKQIGIDCFYCHQDGVNPKWQVDHVVPENWRLKPPLEKQTLGMRDLANTATQARLCFDCHVGNQQKNMFVSHDMYAAGHPPLPSIEVQTFCDQMPQHWRTPGQLYESLRDEKDRTPFFAVNYPGITNHGTMFWNTRKMLIGALEAKRHQLDLLIESSKSDHWADYALYDCTACHHELEGPSVRQDRYTRQGYDGAPGRPRVSEWPLPLLRVAYRVGPQDQLAKAMMLTKDLKECFDRTPFGDPEEVRTVAIELKKEIGILTAAAEKRQINDANANAILNYLSKTPDDALVTYDAARQTAWALDVIAKELATQNVPIDDARRANIQLLGDPSVTNVQTGLPSGRAQFIFPDSLRLDLDYRANYDPRRFIDQLRLCQPLGQN